MSNAISEAQLRSIPKVELHRHLELSLRPSTIRELAPQFGIQIPDDKTFAERFLIREPMKDLGSVLNKFLDTQLLLSNEEILERISFEACEDAFNEGVRLLELRYAPTFVKYRHENLNFDQIHQSILRGVSRAERAYPMAVGLVCIIQRILSVKEAEDVTQFAIANRDSFVGLDIADNEEGFDSKPFAPFFAKARSAGLQITAHAGEVNAPKAPRYVRDAIDYLGATRIGHGIHVIKDSEMVNYVKEKKIVFEVCVKSNYLTQAVPGEIKDHPIKKLIQAGVLVTINTDDPGIFATDLVEEYGYLQKYFDFTAEDFKKCNDIAAKASFIPAHKKSRFWPGL